jgi:desulfoferrodoxin (superoxide reductase-like protein)
MTPVKPILSALLILAMAVPALANKTSVTIKAPETATAGTEVAIVVNVDHKGNSGFHHTDWVVVQADGVEIARWEFKAKSLPESAGFTREVKLKIVKAVEITAQGHCNLHGSAGPVAVKIAV